MFEVKVRNVKTGEVNTIETVYDYRVGEVVYPFNLREKYPGYNENKHVVVDVKKI